MKVIATEIDIKTDKAEASLNDVVAALGDIKKGLDNNTKATEDGSKATKTLESNFQKAAKGVKGFGLALKAAGIGLFIELFSAFKEVLGQNQKVVDLFSTGMESLSIAFNDLFKFIEDNFGTITGFFKDIFENPKENLEDFADAIKNNLIERFNSLLDTLGYLATAAKKVFEGDFAGALESVKDAAKESVDVLTGVNNSSDKLAEVIPRLAGSISDYAKSTFKAASASVALNKQAEIAAVINQGLIEDYDRQAEQQRQIRDDTRKSFEERIEANNKLGEVLEEQQKLMIENADLVVKAAESDLQKNNNQENYIRLLEAENERKAVLAQIEGFRSEQLVNQAGLEAEVADAKRTAEEEEIKRNEELAKIEAERIKKRIENEKLAAAQRVAIGLSAASTLFEIGKKEQKGTEAEQKKAFKRNKLLGIAQASIQTFQSAQGAYLSQLSIPTPDAPFRAAAAAAVAVAAGIANIAKIKRQKFQSVSSDSSNPFSGGGGGRNGSAGVGFNPSSPTISALPSFSQTAAGQQGQGSNVRAYVVQDDIENQAALNKRINQKTTL